MRTQCLFAEHLKPCCAQNSEELLRTPVDEEDGPKRSQAVETVLFRCRDAHAPAEDWVVLILWRNQV